MIIPCVKPGFVPDTSTKHLNPVYEKPDWSKGHLRKGAAYRGLGDLRKW